jgi:hypothetical protein
MATIKDSLGNSLTIEFLPPKNEDGFICDKDIKFIYEVSHKEHPHWDEKIEFIQGFCDMEDEFDSSHSIKHNKWIEPFVESAEILKKCLDDNEACWCRFECPVIGHKSLYFYLPKKESDNKWAEIVLRIPHNTKKHHYIDEKIVLPDRETMVKFAQLLSDEYKEMYRLYYSKLKNIDQVERNEI